MVIINIHQRPLPAPATDVGALIGGLGGKGDRLWPADRWVPMRLDRPLSVGASGGHGFIRYAVTAYQPGVGVTFTFGPGVGLRGTHRFEVDAVSASRAVLRHTIEAKPYGWMRIGWPVAVRWLHDSLIEDALDNAERALTGAVREPSRQSLWVRLLLAVERLTHRRSSKKG